MSSFEFHLKFDEIPLPRRRDRVIMELAMDVTKDKDLLGAIARVRGYLNVIFLSDIVTADGRHLEHFAQVKSEKLVRSKFIFPREHPSDKDWELWTTFWKSWTRDSYELPTPLGKWDAPTHRIWEFFMHDNGDVIYRRHVDGTYGKYVKSDDRGNRFYLMENVRDIENCSPVSVKMFNDNCVRYRSTASLAEEDEEHHDTFWDVLKEGRNMTEA